MGSVESPALLRLMKRTAAIAMLATNSAPIVMPDQALSTSDPPSAVTCGAALGSFDVSSDTAGIPMPVASANAEAPNAEASNADSPRPDAEKAESPKPDPRPDPSDEPNAESALLASSRTAPRLVSSLASLASSMSPEPEAAEASSSRPISLVSLICVAAAGSARSNSPVSKMLMPVSPAADPPRLTASPEMLLPSASGMPPDASLVAVSPDALLESLSTCSLLNMSLSRSLNCCSLPSVAI